MYVHEYLNEYAYDKQVTAIQLVCNSKLPYPYLDFYLMDPQNSYNFGR